MNKIFSDFKPKNFVVHFPIKKDPDDHLAYFKDIKEFELPLEIHEYNNDINFWEYTDSEKKINPSKYFFNKLKKITDEMVWTYITGERNHSYWLETTNEYYILWERNRLVNDDLNYLYDLNFDEGSDEYYQYPLIFNLKCLCKKSNINNKQASILMLYDYWKSVGYDYQPDEYISVTSGWIKDLNTEALLSTEEIDNIFFLLNPRDQKNDEIQEDKVKSKESPTKEAKSEEAPTEEKKSEESGIRERLEKLGYKQTPKDHPIYKTGPTISFRSVSNKGAKKNKDKPSKK